jgi:hypothetical protein
MKKYVMAAALTAVGVALVSCQAIGDIMDEGAMSGELTVGGAPFVVQSGDITHSGKMWSHNHEVITIMIWSDEMQLIEISFNLDKGVTRLPAGTYVWEDSGWVANTFSAGFVNYEYGVFGGESDDIVGGKVTVGLSGDTTTFTFDCDLDNGGRITGSCSGKPTWQSYTDGELRPDEIVTPLNYEYRITGRGEITEELTDYWNIFIDSGEGTYQYSGMANLSLRSSESTVPDTDIRFNYAHEFTLAIEHGGTSTIGINHNHSSETMQDISFIIWSDRQHPAPGRYPFKRFEYGENDPASRYGFCWRIGIYTSRAITSAGQAINSDGADSSNPSTSSWVEIVAMDEKTCEVRLLGISTDWYEGEIARHNISYKGEYDHRDDRGEPF